MMDKIKLQKARTSFWQKISLLLLGIFLALCLLEIGLRLGGSMILFFQEQRNQAALQQKDAYRIMCIGESTTQGHYPQPLQEFLNKEHMGINFSVIDKGLVATDTFLILSQLEENIRKYHPQMVVAMLGINDGGMHLPAKFNSPAYNFLSSLKVYKLAQLISLHLENKIQEIKRAKKSDTMPENFTKSLNVPPPERETGSDIFYCELGKQLQIQGKEALAKEAFKKAIKLNPYNMEAYRRLNDISADQEESEAVLTQALKFCNMILDSDKFSSEQREGIFWIAGALVYSDTYPKEVESLLNKFLSRDPKSHNAYIFLGYLFFTQGRYEEAEDYLKKSIELDRNNNIAFDYLALLYHDTGRFDLSEDYLRMANKLRSGYYSVLTIDNYKKMKNILDKHKIKLVCVQYPLRKIQPLKDIFGNDQSIIFVDNERTFKDALRKKPYKDLFMDLFAGDFGHTTPEGDKLLARQIAKTILKEAFKKDSATF